MGSIRSQNQRSLFSSLVSDLFPSTAHPVLHDRIVLQSSSRHPSSPSTSQLGSRRGSGDRSVSRVPGVCLNYGNRPRVPAPGFDSHFWNCIGDVATPSPRPALLQTSLLVRRVAPAKHPRIAPPCGSFNNWRLALLDKAIETRNIETRNLPFKRTPPTTFRTSSDSDCISLTC